MSKQIESSVLRAPLAGLLAWILPGLGHIYLGHRTRGLILMVTITATFWSGVAIGGVAGTVNPDTRKLWFVAQLCTGGNTLAAASMTSRVMAALPPSRTAPYLGHWSAIDIGVHYTGVAGLLNLLVILDAIARADAPGSGRRNKRKTPQGSQ